MKRIEKEKKCGEKSDLGIAIKKKADKGEKEREREREKVKEGSAEILAGYIQQIKYATELIKGLLIIF